MSDVIVTRQWATGELRKRGFEVTDSKTNFVFASPAGISAKEMFERLRERGIYVRWWDKDRLRDWLRISVGTDAEMKTLVEAIDEIMKG